MYLRIYVCATLFFNALHIANYMISGEILLPIAPS